MKRIVLAVLVLAGVAGAALWRGSRAVPPDYYAEYLPADALATLVLLDLEGMSKTFPHSEPGKLLAKPVMHEVMAELGAQPDDLQRYDELHDGVADLLTNPVFRQIFGDDAVVGLLAPDPAQLALDPGRALKDALMAFGTSSAAGSIDSMARLVMGSDFVRERIGGLDMTRIRLDDGEVMYGHARNGTVLLACRPERIVAAVRQKNAGGGLGRSASFAAARKFWAESPASRRQAEAYLNVAKVSELMAASKQAFGRSAAVHLQGFRSVGGTAGFHRSDFRVDARAEYDSESLHEGVRRRLRLRSEENISLPLLNDKTLLYAWFSALDQQTVHDILSFGGSLQFRAADAAVRQEFGMSIGQIMDALGPQAGLRLDGIVNAGFLPLPKALLFSQIRQPEAARQVVDGLRAWIGRRGLAREQVAQADGHRIHYWSLWPTEAAHPAIALNDVMLYAANGESIVKTALVAGRSGMSEAMLGQLGPELSRQLTAANSAAFVLRPARLAADLQEKAEWIAGMLSPGGAASARRLRKELLVLLQSTEIAAGWTRAEDDHALSTLVLRPMAAEKTESNAPPRP